MNKPNLNKIIVDNLDKAKFQSKSQPSLPTDNWLNNYSNGRTYLSDRAKATQFGQYKKGGGYFPEYHSFAPPMMSNGGGLLSRTVTCSNCGWSWKAVDGGKDVMTCHKCGGMIEMKQGGNISIPDLERSKWLSKYDDGGLTTTDTTKPEGGWGCKGKSCTMTGEGIKKVGVRDQPSDEGSGGGYVNYAGFNSPITWDELLNYNTPSTGDLSKKQANKVINNYKENAASRAAALQSTFPGVTQNQILAAMGDSSRIAQRRSDTLRYNQPSEQTFDKAYHRFYQPLINQPARVTVPQILQFHSQQPFGLQGYQQTVQGNYGRKKAEMGGEWLTKYDKGGVTCPEGFINIDGKCIETNSQQYRDMLDNGQVGTMKDGVFYGNKSELQPVTVFASKDKDTQQFYDRLRTANGSGDYYPADYESLIKLGQKYGFPKVSLKDKANTLDLTDINLYDHNKKYRAYYNPINNRISLDKNSTNKDLVETYLAELSHYVQHKKHSILSLGLREGKTIARTLKNSIVNLESPVDAYNREYDAKGSIENEAHNEIEPQLFKNFYKNYSDRMLSDDYYQYPGTFSFIADKAKTYKNGGWLTKYAPGGVTTETTKAPNFMPNMSMPRAIQDNTYRPAPINVMAIDAANKQRQQQAMLNHASKNQTYIKQGHAETAQEKTYRAEQLRKKAQQNSDLAQTFGMLTPMGSNPEAGAIAANDFVNMNPVVSGPIMSASRLYGAGRSMLDPNTSNPYFSSNNGAAGNIMGGLQLAGDIGMLRMGTRSPKGNFNVEPMDPNLYTSRQIPSPQVNWWEEPNFAKRNPNFNPVAYGNSVNKFGKPFTSISQEMIPYSAEERAAALQAKLQQQAGDILLNQKKEGGLIADPMGQWAHPGQNTRIPGNNITMQGVPYPVLAKASNGMSTMMYPGQDYSFPGASHVDEYPMMQQGGGWLDKYNLPKADDGLQTGLPNPRDYKEYSIVNYLAKNGYPVDKKFRKNLAEQHNIEDYDYSADKNLELLHTLMNDENFKSRVAEEQSNAARSVPVEKQGLNQGVLNLMMADIAPRSSNPKRVNTSNLFGSATGTTPRPVMAPIRNTGFKQAPPAVIQPKVQIPAFDPYAFLKPNTLQPIINQAVPVVKQTQSFNQVPWNKNPMNPQNFVKGTKPVTKQAQQNIEEGYPIKKKQQPLSNDIGMEDLLGMFTLPGMVALGSKISSKLANNEKIQDASSIYKERGLSGLIDAYKNKQIRDKGLATGDDSTTITNFTVPTVPANSKDSLSSPVIFGKQVVDTDRRDNSFYHAPMYIDLNRAKFGFKNRGGKPSTEQNGITETAGLVLTPFASEYASPSKIRNSRSDDFLGTSTIRKYKDSDIRNDGVYGGIDDQGNFQLGYGKDMKGKNLTMADFRTIDTEGFVKDSKGNYKLGTETSNKRVSKVPHIKTDKGEDHLPFLVPNSGKNQDKTYGQNTGGKIIIATPDFKEKILVGGSLSDVDKALENFKAKHKLSKVKLIVLDNGTYSRGFMKKGNKISSKDWSKYEVNSSGGAGFYLKGKGFKEGGSINNQQDNNWLDKYQFAGAVGSTLSAIGPILTGPGSAIYRWANHEPDLKDAAQNLADPTVISNVPFVNQSIRKMVAEPSWTHASGLGMDLVGMVPVFGEGARAARAASMAKNVNTAIKVGRTIGKGVGAVVKPIAKVVEAPAQLVKQGYRAVGASTPAFNNGFNLWNKGVNGYKVIGEAARQGLNAIGKPLPDGMSYDNMYATGGENKNWLNKYK